MFLGLKIDVCTYDGLRLGVPNLLRLLDRHSIRASFFVALGPDTSGRAIFQLFRPGFLSKMRRTRAIRTYGLRTILSGTVLPPRHIGRELAHILRDIAQAGHEVAVHGYDHRRWQDHLHTMSAQAVGEELDRAVTVYREVLGVNPRGFGAPGWQCNASSLKALDALGFLYASDTRGGQPFLPRVGGRVLSTLQIPTTLPTLDEMLGVSLREPRGLVEFVRRVISTQAWPVLTSHAEMEGAAHLPTMDRLVCTLRQDGVIIRPLEILAKQVREVMGDGIPVAGVFSRPTPGRTGTVAMPEPEKIA